MTHTLVELIMAAHHQGPMPLVDWQQRSPVLPERHTHPRARRRPQPASAVSETTQHDQLLVCQLGVYGGWCKLPYYGKRQPQVDNVNQREIKREAKFRAGLILESVVAAGWSGDMPIVERYGQDGADLIADEINKIAARLIQQSS
jgi:hypothetical protein